MTKRKVFRRVWSPKRGNVSAIQQISLKYSGL